MDNLTINQDNAQVLAVTFEPATTAVADAKYTLPYFTQSVTTVPVSTMRTITAPPDPGTGERMILNMSRPFNQINSSIFANNNMYRSACMAFAYACAMTYYSQLLISPAWLKFSGGGPGLLPADSIAILKKANGTNALGQNRKARTLAEIKTAIDQGKPVVIHGIGTGVNVEHWVVAYGYKNNCADKGDLLVMDSINTTSIYFGKYAMLDKCMDDNKVTPLIGNVRDTGNYVIDDSVIFSVL